PDQLAALDRGLRLTAHDLHAAGDRLPQPELLRRRLAAVRDGYRQRDVLVRLGRRRRGDTHIELGRLPLDRGDPAADHDAGPARRVRVRRPDHLDADVTRARLRRRLAEADGGVPAYVADHDR